MSITSKASLMPTVFALLAAINVLKSHFFGWFTDAVSTAREILTGLTQCWKKVVIRILLHRQGNRRSRWMMAICLLLSSRFVPAATPVKMNDGNGDGLVFTDHFDGSSHNDILTYYKDSQNWQIMIWNGKRLEPSIVGNTAGFGNLDDGRPIWSGDFDGDGRADVLFYSSDGNFWLGSYSRGVLSWRVISNTSGARPGDNNFGSLTRSTIRIWTGNFSRSDVTQVLFYYAGDSNWWLGSWDGSRLEWSLADNTVGFGKLLNNRVFVNDFEGGLSEVVFYAPGDSHWWLGSFSGSKMTWRSIGTTGFGNLANGQPMWAGDFEGRAKAAIMFYSPSDHNWWTGYLVGSQLQWALVSNTAGFGNLADGRPIFLDRFTSLGQVDIVFFHPSDNSWWLGQFNGDHIIWTLASNTAGFGPGSPASFSTNTVTGAFSTALTQFVWFSPGDRHVWLGSFSGTTLNWSLANAPSPNAPTNLKVTGVTANTVSLAWTNNNAMNDAVYTTHLERASSASGTFQEVASLSGGTESFTDFGLAQGTVYSFRVKAETPLDSSGYSNVASAKPEPPPPSISLDANPSTINKGQSSTLNFSVSGATTESITGIGTIPAAGNRLVTPLTTTTYTLTASGPGGVSSESVTVTVNVPPTSGTLPVSLAEEYPSSFSYEGNVTDPLLYTSAPKKHALAKSVTNTSGSTYILWHSGGQVTLAPGATYNIPGQLLVEGLWDAQVGGVAGELPSQVSFTIAWIAPQ